MVPEFLLIFPVTQPLSCHEIRTTLIHHCSHPQKVLELQRTSLIAQIYGNGMTTDWKNSQSLADVAAYWLASCWPDTERGWRISELGLSNIHWYPEKWIICLNPLSKVLLWMGAKSCTTLDGWNPKRNHGRSRWTLCYSLSEITSGRISMYFSKCFPPQIPA